MPAIVLLAGLSLASCHSTTVLYKPPPSATPATFATVTGSASARNAFNENYGCLVAIDDVNVSTHGPFYCKHIAQDHFLVAPGKHRLVIGVQWESGQFSTTPTLLVTAELAAGQVYSVHAEEVADTKPDHHKIQIWLQDSQGEVLGGKQEHEFEDPAASQERWDEVARKAREAGPYYQVKQSNPSPLNPATLPQIRHLLVYADFGEHTYRFEHSFTERVPSLAASCGIGFKLLTVAHAGKLTLDTPVMPPSAEIDRLAVAEGADYWLKIATREWAGDHAPPNDLSTSFTDGALNIEVELHPAGGAVLWHPAYIYTRVNKGGDAFAEQLIEQIAKHGSLPGCPPAPAQTGDKKP